MHLTLWRVPLHRKRVFRGKQASPLLNVAEARYITRAASDVRIKLLPKELARKRGAVLNYRVHFDYPNAEIRAASTACGNDGCASVCFIY